MAFKPFKFKQFKVNQDRCAMKIGTDGVLLGAWTPIQSNVDSILDVGTGTGLIALMMAQRSAALTLDALEIDENAYEQAVENFENSIWSDRLFCYHASFQEFFSEIDEEYDLIISNPPFYTDQYSSGNPLRDQARFIDALPFEHLLYGVQKLLSEQGKFSVIIPYGEEQSFIKLANHYQLFINKITRVKGTSNSEVKRSLLYFSKNDSDECITDELVIEKSRHDYTDAYIALTKDFYFKM